jgi:hypothetical protein
LKSAEDVKKEIFELYEKDPTEWRVLSGRDRHGYHDLIVMHGTDLWIIKEQLINPYKSVGFAVKTFGKGNNLESFQTPQCGIRPISQTQIEEITQTIEKGRSVREVLSEIMTHRPISFRDLRSPAIVQGPILHVNQPTDLVSTRQRDLDLKLRAELEKLLMKKYRQTMVPYV